MSASFQKYISNKSLKNLSLEIMWLLNIKLILTQTLPYEVVGSKTQTFNFDMQVQ